MQREAASTQMAADTLARAIFAVLSSPNEADRNGETANVVDGLYAIARSIDNLASAIRGRDDLELGEPLGHVAK